MSGIVLKWGDGEYLFALKVKQLEELQRVCGPTPKDPVGFQVVANRLFQGRAFIGDIVHTIRLGLIGGGMDAVRAKQMVDTYVDGQTVSKPGDLASPLATAQAIMGAVFFGLEDTEPGEAGAAEPIAPSTSRPSKPMPSESSDASPLKSSG